MHMPLAWEIDYFANKAADNNFEWQDYYEAIIKTDVVYFGSRQQPPLEDQYNDLEKNDISSPYYGNVFFPERKTRESQGQKGQGGRETGWTYEKNAAFWAGAITKRRPMLLVTPIQNYTTAIGKGTVDEIFWLLDNSYKCFPDPANVNQTWFIPLTEPQLESKLKEYRNGYGQGIKKLDMQKRLATLRSEVVNQRSEYSKNFEVLFNNSQQLMHLGTQLNDIVMLKSALAGIEKALALNSSNQELLTIHSDLLNTIEVLTTRAHEDKNIPIKEEKNNTNIIDTLPNISSPIITSKSSFIANIGAMTANDQQQIQKYYQEKLQGLESKNPQTSENFYDEQDLQESYSSSESSESEENNLIISKLNLNKK